MDGRVDVIILDFNDISCFVLVVLEVIHNGFIAEGMGDVKRKDKTFIHFGFSYRHVFGVCNERQDKNKSALAEG